MKSQNDVTLSVNGLKYGGFTSVRITAGIERQARDFQLDTTQRWPGQSQDFPIRQGDKVEVRIGNDLVLTGFVDATPVNYDANSISRSIVGRSLTADLVDCSAEFNQWRDQSLLEIIKALASQVGVSVVSQVDASRTVSDHSVDPTETLFESIDRLLTISRLLSTDNGKGQLLLIKPSSGGHAVDKLQLGENILSCQTNLDFSKCFRKYKVIGQRSGSDDLSATDISEVTAEHEDARIKRNRLLIIQQSGQLTPELAKDRAEWEATNRINRSLSVTYSVVGWRQSTGQLWLPNQLVRVKDEIVGIDRDLLIAEVTYELSSSGMVTHLHLAPPNGFEPKPEVGKSLGSSDSFEYLLPADWNK